MISAGLGALGGTLSGYVLARRHEHRACEGAVTLIADELFVNSVALRAVIAGGGHVLDRHREFPRRDWDDLRTTLVGCIDEAARRKLVVFYAYTEAYSIAHTPGSSLPPAISKALAAEILSDLESAYTALTGSACPSSSSQDRATRLQTPPGP